MRRDVPPGMKSVLYAAATHFPYCTASLELLALEAGVSRRTCGKYLRVLEAEGFMTVSASYKNGVRGRLIDFVFDKPDQVRAELEAADDVGQGDQSGVANHVVVADGAHGGAIGVTEVADEVGREYPDCQQTININNQEQSTEQPFARAEPRREEGSPFGAEEMKNDALSRTTLFSAVLQVCGLNESEMTSSALGALHKAVKELHGLKGEVSVDEVRQRAERYRLAYPKATLTPSALVKHWPSLGGDGPRVNTAGGIISEYYDVTEF